MTLNNSSYFWVWSLAKWRIISFLNIWRCYNHFPIVCWVKNARRFSIWWPTLPWSTPTLPIRSKSFWTVGTDTINFKFSKEEDIFIILTQNDFKHKLVQMFFLSFIVLIFYLEWSYNLYSIEWNSRDWSSEVANWMVVIFVVSERSSW